MNSDKFAQAVLDKIKEKKIEPKSRISFLFKEYSVWAAGFLALVVGGAAFSVVLHMVNSNDWDYYPYISGSFLGFLLMTLPYFWLLSMLLFGALVFFNIRHTKKGYRYRAVHIFLIVLAGSAILGSGLFAAGAGEAIDEILYKNVPHYSEFGNRRYKIWNSPGRGFLAGRIVSVSSRDLFSIEDFRLKSWIVNAEQALILPPIRIISGENVRLVGNVLGTGNFQAKIVGPDKKVGEKVFHGWLMHASSTLMMPHSGGNQPAGDIEQFNRIFESIVCNNHPDCPLHMEFAPRSDCPFESICAEGRCHVACFASGAQEEIVLPCGQNGDCNCDFYPNLDSKDCLCLDGKCAAIVR